MQRRIKTLPRARTIKPGFFTNEEVGSLPALTRLLFIGLWTLADRDGKLEYRPLRIKAHIFPFDSVNVEKSLEQLERCGLVVIYDVDAVKYIMIPTWGKHQHPHIKEPASTIPAPVLHHAEPGSAPCETSAGQVQKRPITYYCNPDLEPPLTPPVGVECVTEPPLVTRQRAWFEEFWSEVWLKVGKDGVWAKFKSRVRDEKTFLKVMAGVKRDAPIQRSKERQFQVHPKTWMNEGRWKDEEEPAALFGPPAQEDDFDRAIREAQEREAETE